MLSISICVLLNLGPSWLSVQNTELIFCIRGVVLYTHLVNIITAIRTEAKTRGLKDHQRSWMCFQLMKKKVKVIYLYRNPKDTFVSLYCHLSKMQGVMGYRGSWNHFFYTMLEMGCEHVTLHFF